MKININKILVLFSLYALPFLVSCSKDSESNTMLSTPGDEIRIKISINGVRSVSNIEKLAHAKSINNTVPNNEYLSFIKGEANDFMLSVDHEKRFNVPSQLSKRNLMAENQSSSMRPDPYPETVDVLEMGTKYMVMMYDRDNNHILSKLMTVGGDELIKLQRSTGVVLDGLRFVLFSYNTKEESDFDYINTNVLDNNLEAKIRTDREFLYENHGALRLDFDEEHDEVVANLGFLLHRMNSKIGVVLDARGYFAKITNAKVKLSGTNVNSYFKEGSINLRDNIITLGDYADMSEEELTLRYSDNVGQDTVGLYLYTVSNSNYSSIADFKVELSELSVSYLGEHYDNLITSKISLDFNTVNFLQGEQINARVRLLAKGFKVNNLLWSNANLYYDDFANDGYKYKIRNTPWEGHGEVYKFTDYWRSDNLLPNLTGNKGDPCAQVYPAGLWRLPTQDEQMVFVNSSNYTPAGLKQERKHDSVLDKRYVRYSYLNGDAGELIFAMAGYYVGDLLTYPEGSGVFLNNRVFSITDDMSALSFTVSENAGTMTDAMVYYPDGTLNTKRRFNIRCVRPIVKTVGEINP